MKQKSWFRLFLLYIEAYLLGVFLGLIPLSLLLGLMHFEEEGVMGIIMTVLFIPFVGMLAAPVLTLPAIFLGYLVSYALHKRKVDNVFTWVLWGVFVGGLNGFALSMGAQYLIFLQAFVGGFVAYFMWRRI